MFPEGVKFPVSKFASSNTITFDCNGIEIAPYFLSSSHRIKNYKVEDGKRKFDSKGKYIGQEKIMTVEFMNGHVHIVVCRPEDKFSVEMGLTVAMAKELMGSTKSYNDEIRSVIKSQQKKDKEKLAAIQAKKEKEAHRLARIRRKKERKHQEQVQIQAEAILLANRLMKATEEMLKDGDK